MGVTRGNGCLESSRRDREPPPSIIAHLNYDGKDFDVEIGPHRFPNVTAADMPRLVDFAVQFKASHEMESFLRDVCSDLNYLLRPEPYRVSYAPGDAHGEILGGPAGQFGRVSRDEAGFTVACERGTWVVQSYWRDCRAVADQIAAARNSQPTKG
jgi:hypothetical protein